MLPEIYGLTEQWKDVPGYEGLYLISTHGRLISLLGRQPKLITYGFGGRNKEYIAYSLSLNGKVKRFFAHRLVLLAFVGKPRLTQECRHLNGNGYDNFLSNLEWGTDSENKTDRAKHGRYYCLKGEQHPMAKLKTSDVKSIRHQRNQGLLIREIAERFGIAQSSASQICSGQRWSHICSQS